MTVFHFYLIFISIPLKKRTGSSIGQNMTPSILIFWENKVWNKKVAGTIPIGFSEGEILERQQ